jgi:hypothetical protein
VDDELLEARVRLRGGRLVGDVELVVQVAVDRVPLGLDGGDRLPRGFERDRLVEQELPRDGIGDDRSLVTDEGLGQAGVGCIAAHRLEHPAGDEQNVDAALPRRAQRRLRAGVQEGVLADQGPVDVAREDRDVAREIRRQSDGYFWPCVKNATRSAICFGVSDVP